MAISSFAPPAVAAAVEQEVWYLISTTGTDLMLPASLNSGLYRLRAYATALNSTPTVSYKLYDSADALVSTTNSVDTDSGSSVNYSEAIVSVPGAGHSMLINTNTAGYITIQKVMTNGAVGVLSLTTYTTSQSITITGTAKCALFGAGGGAPQGGGGAGSGYLTKFTLGAGTYSLVVGAGGSPGSNGGQSTFAGYTANGGLAPSGANGGAGGSGGGGANYGSSTTFAGGKNGANGASSGYGTGGTGSGVARPLYLPDVNNIYTGGSGMAAIQDNYSYGVATGIAAGGGSGRDYYTTLAGGTGGPGGLAVLY